MALDTAEVPALQRSRDISFYLVLIGLVLPFWSIIPLSWAFVIYAFNSGRISLFAWPGRTFLAIAILEVLFSIYHHRLASRVSHLNASSHDDLLEIQRAFRRLLKTGLANLPEDGGDEESLCISRPGSPDEAITQLEPTDPRAIDFRNSLRTWFRKVPWSSLRLHEVRKWIFWAIYNSEMPPPEQLSHVQRAVLDDALEHLQKRTGCKIPQGSNPEYQPMCLTIDPVKIRWRPFSYYILIAFINRYLRTWFRDRYDVKCHSYQGLETWDASSGPRPILFIHGLGLGLLQYNVFLRHFFTAVKDRPLLVPLQPQISQDLFHPQYLTPPNRRQTVNKLTGLLHELGWVHLSTDGDDTESTIESEDEAGRRRLRSSKRGGVTVLSHSNGSYIHAWLLKDCPNVVARSCFVDPVTFCSWEGDVCYNFIYRSCTTGTELLMRYFVSTELGVANLLQRHFEWASNSLWYEEIPNARDPSKTFFLLGGRDAIVQAERVRRYLKSHGITKGLWYDPAGRHGQALMAGGPGHVEILRWLREPDN
ncbi:hypothetical protein AX17_001049 [Amanita inopinata Kibby_2008]|nr:hypothetical protein AX17_001049 [Amanita inopinata Kibby_2008]